MLAGKSELNSIQLLFWIVGGIGKYSRIDSSCDTIKTLNHNTVLVGLNEVIVQEKPPDGMHKLALAVGENIFIFLFP